MRPKAFVLLLVLLGVLPLAADTYPRQPLDVEHYRFALTLSDATDQIAGEATVRVRMLAAGVPAVTLDLGGATPGRSGRGMTVERVTVDGAPATYTHSADRLTITLPAPSRDRQRVELGIRYVGIPADGLQIKPNRHGDRTFFSDNWPDKARQWLPTIDHISDKATMEMVVDAPAHYQVVSNGRRVEETDLPAGMRRTVWHEAVPIPPWLYALGVARFAVQHVGDYNGVPIETWVFAQDRDAGFYDFAVPTRQALAFYSEWVGPYSYEKLANVQSNSVGGGMEAASVLFYAPGSVVGDRNTRWRNVVIHEIAHQWFGNAITEHDWDDVWLSEGFATYFTQLFIEHAYGRDEFVENMRRSRQTILDFYAKTPDYRIVHDNLDDMSRVTTGMTYQKGAWVLHMLRQRMGDERFWTGIRTYHQRYKDASASTTDFREVMEQSSGESLTTFFDQWLYRGGNPRLSVTWAWDAAARTVTVDVKQIQPGPPFLLPVELGVRTATGATRIERVEMTGASATATFKAEQEPVDIVVDPNVRLLMAAESTSRRSFLR
ncbi:MAG: M1 family aminopeptidase [Acidobacteria bacterium]|nr:M1 family aminopeptidase [Acidobacteriota bacterium]